MVSTGLATAIVVTVLSAVGLVVASIVLAAGGRKLRDGERPPDREEMRRHLAFGIIYCNPDDPRGWVPKVSGPGGTVNARTRAGAVVMLVLTITTVAAVVLTLVQAFASFR